jgi:hypothetical protein
VEFFQISGAAGWRVGGVVFEFDGAGFGEVFEGGGADCLIRRNTLDVVQKTY